MTESEDHNERPAVATVTLRRLQSDPEQRTRAVGVFCPRRGRPVDVGTCRECEHCCGLYIDPRDRETFLRCAFVNAPAESSDDAAANWQAPEPPTTKRLGLETKLSSIMTQPVRCVTADTSVVSLLELFFTHGISAAPVVDGQGKTVGIVSKSDLLREIGPRVRGERPVEFRRTGSEIVVEVASGLASSCSSNLRVSDVMVHAAYALAPDASASRASALMAYEGVHRVVVAASDGTPLGIVSSLDILRWLARADGYVIP